MRVRQKKLSTQVLLFVVALSLLVGLLAADDPRLVAAQLANVGRDEERVAHCLKHRARASAEDLEYFHACVASSLCFLKRYAECRDEFAAFLRLFPGSPLLSWAHVSLAIALNGLGDTAGAEAEYRLAGEEGALPLAHLLYVRHRACRDAVPVYEQALARAERLQDPVAVAESLTGEVGCRNRAIGPEWSERYFERAALFRGFGGLSRSHLLANRCREFFAGVSPAKCVEMMEDQAALLVENEDDDGGGGGPSAFKTWPRPSGPAGRRVLRVAYISSRGFDGDILSTRLTQSLFALHDRGAVAVLCVSYGGAPGGGPWPEQELVRRSCDEFVTVGSDGPELAAAVRRLRADVTVDLQSSHRAVQYRRLRSRPALLQVHFHGTPGTMGTPHLDHIVTDPVTTPAHLGRALFTEGLLLLGGGGSYLYSSHRSAYPWDRSEEAAAASLPEELPPRSARVFVFCSFNAPFKLTPGLWRAMMGALKRTRRSVLWMLEFDPNMAQGLRREAELAGVDPRRVIVTRLLPRNIEFAAKSRCDLFLDSPLFSGHSTLLDTLHAGVPVLTAAATADMVSRVGVGLVAAAGLDRETFIVDAPSPAEIVARLEDRAVWLATDPEGQQRLASAREHLRRSSEQGTGVFDEQAGARRLETALLAAFEAKRQGRGRVKQVF